jgi:hypothetical protein
MEFDERKIVDPDYAIIFMSRTQKEMSVRCELFNTESTSSTDPLRTSWCCMRATSTPPTSWTVHSNLRRQCQKGFQVDALLPSLKNVRNGGRHWCF